MYKLTSLLILMTAFTVNQALAQTSFYVSGSEFHWTRGAAPPFVQMKISRELTENNFRPSPDSNKADLIIKVKCNSYFNGQTPYFFFACLDASLNIYDRNKGKLIYSNDLRRIKGGSTSLELADEKVYANASQIIADTLLRFIYFYKTGKPLTASAKQVEFEALCDADKDIPDMASENKNTYVLIIANDAYSPMQTARCFSDSADYHARDARVFREYAIHTLGIPARNVSMTINAKSFEIRRELIKLSSYSKGVDGNAELIFYYAGYGLIDEKTLEPYILPVDIENDDPKFIVRISDLYKMLQEDASRRISILLECSFQFDALKPKPAKTKLQKIQLNYPNVPANAVFMAAAAPTQKAWSSKEAGHGLFTLALLNKLKETKGKASLKELSDFIIKDVRSASLKMKLKEQVPHSLFGSSLTKSISILKL
jgi:hypothetical protein